MNKLELNDQQKTVLKLLAQENRPLAISDIENLLNTKLPRRSLQRELSQLKQAKFITSQGKLKNTTYEINHSTNHRIFSENSLKIRDEIKRPLVERTPVPYNLEFLYSYEPNRTFFLDEQTREHLKETGQTYKEPIEPSTYTKQILNRLLIDLSWNSSRLEGNTYSLIDTERLIEFGAESEGKNFVETQMILNHKEAIEFLCEQINDTAISKYVILNIHGLLANNLLGNPKARGQLRQIPVGIGKTVYHPPEIPQVIEDCFNQIIEKANQIENPFEQAFFLLVQLPYLQPFEDVNKRTSRLAVNIPLLKHSYAPFSFIDIPKQDYTDAILAIYELNKTDLMRDLFVWGYEHSSQKYKVIQNTLGEPDLLYMKYRKDITHIVQHIIRNNIHGTDIVHYIDQYTKEHISESEHRRFIQLAEKEIAGMHEGNIAVYKISIETFERWNKTS